MVYPAVIKLFEGFRAYWTDIALLLSFVPSGRGVLHKTLRWSRSRSLPETILAYVLITGTFLYGVDELSLSMKLNHYARQEDARKELADFVGSFEKQKGRASASELWRMRSEIAHHPAIMAVPARERFIAGLLCAAVAAASSAIMLAVLFLLLAAVKTRV